MKTTLILIECVIIVLICAKQIKRKTQIIRQCYLMIENIEMNLGYKNSTTKEIFYDLYNSDLYSELCFISIIISNIKSNISDYICCDETFSCIDSVYIMDKTDKENIKSFLTMLGKTDFNGQIMNCKLYKDYFKNKLKLLEEKENSKCKSITTIIVGVGLFIAIIIA